MSRSQLARAGLGVTSEDDLAEREARLGTPIFAAPGAGIMPQLASMAEQSNEDMVPGSPPMLPTVMRTQGSNIWAALLLDEFVKRILGD
jgi:hypothetical protein